MERGVRGDRSLCAVGTILLPPDMPLSPRQTLFAEALAQGKTQIESGRLAGYKPHDGYLSQLANKPLIKSHVDRLLRDRRETEELTVDWWRAMLAKVSREADADGDRPSLLAALRLIGQHLGALEPQAPVSTHTRELMVLIRDSLATPSDALPAPLVRPLTE